MLAQADADGDFEERGDADFELRGLEPGVVGRGFVLDGEGVHLAELQLLQGGAVGREIDDGDGRAAGLGEGLVFYGKLLVGGGAGDGGGFLAGELGEVRQFRGAGFEEDALRDVHVGQFVDDFQAGGLDEEGGDDGIAMAGEEGRDHAGEGHIVPDDAAVEFGGDGVAEGDVDAGGLEMGVEVDDRRQGHGGAVGDLGLGGGGGDMGEGGAGGEGGDVVPRKSTRHG